MTVKRITAPFEDETIADLKAGDRVLISGVVYAARDAAHQRMYEAIERNLPLPFELRGQVIYYVGPTQAKPGQVSGSAGPTTSGRVDPYTPALLERGLKGMIGKGYRYQTVKEAIVRNRAVYFAAVGGAGALIARKIRAVELVTYEDLGPEAIRRMTIEDFPAVVINDPYGGDWYTQAVENYRLS